jgi:hypothetical protein
MSRTIVKAVWYGKRSKNLFELQNSYGSAPVIWQNMSDRYIGAKYWWDEQNMKLVWKLVKNPDIPIEHRAVLAMTFYKALILKEHYERAFNDLFKYLSDFPIDPRYVNHWPRILDFFDSKPNYPAIGFYMTTVGNDPFRKLDRRGRIMWDGCFSVYHYMDRVTNNQETISV